MPYNNRHADAMACFLAQSMRKYLLEFFATEKSFVLRSTLYG